MIKKLRQKIFLIIMISLSLVIISIIILIAFLNYRETINTSTLMLDRFITGEPQRPGEGRENINLETDIEGLYTFIVENEKVVYSSETSNVEELEQFAINVSIKRRENGIWKNYIYKKLRNKNSNIIILMENESVVSHIKMILVLAIGSSLVSAIFIYCLAKKISKVIVEPIEKTFEKQKQFISDASHELKTPLAVIEANADVLENEMGNNKWLNYIQNEIDSMNHLINELLLLAKIENIDNLKEYKNFDLSKEVEIIVSMFESMAYEKNISLKSNIKQKLYMNGNKEDIEHIVSTLLDNAIKHSINSVEVNLSENKNSFILEVKNEGEAIPEEEREKIFERFYRVDKSRNRNEKRYGLGLAIAKSIVQKYRGKIEVMCKDGVTVFRVSIPT